MDDVDTLKKQLAAALVEIEELRLRLSNVMLLLRREMREGGKLPDPTSADPASR